MSMCSNDLHPISHCVFYDTSSFNNVNMTLFLQLQIDEETVIDQIMQWRKTEYPDAVSYTKHLSWSSTKEHFSIFQPIVWFYLTLLKSLMQYETWCVTVKFIAFSIAPKWPQDKQKKMNAALTKFKTC